MARAREIPAVQKGATFREAAASAVEVRTAELFSLSEGVLEIDDIEGVHDMRVASRRLRAAMEVFAPCFPKKEFKRALRDVKALADALGERRDPDVAITRLDEVRRGLAADDGPGVEHLIQELRSRQRSANDRLSNALERAHESELRERLVAMADAARVP